MFQCCWVGAVANYGSLGFEKPWLVLGKTKCAICEDSKTSFFCVGKTPSRLLKRNFISL
jgi:hypothetical protein